jgi:hypothetical protein
MEGDRFEQIWIQFQQGTNRGPIFYNRQPQAQSGTLSTFNDDNNDQTTRMCPETVPQAPLRDDINGIPRFQRDRRDNKHMAEDFQLQSVCGELRLLMITCPVARNTRSRLDVRPNVSQS